MWSAFRKAVRGGRGVARVPEVRPAGPDSAEWMMELSRSSLPENERPRQLAPLRKALTDTVKMIACRAETALVGLLRPHLAKEDEARALIREIRNSEVSAAQCSSLALRANSTALRVSIDPDCRVASSERARVETVSRLVARAAVPS